MASFWVVDTNLLVDWCIFELAERGRPGSFERAVQRLQYVRLAIERDALRQILRQRRAAITPQIAVETGWVAHRLLGGGPSPEFVRAFHRICDEANIQIEETSLSEVQTLASDPAFGLGHVDASLVTLVNRLRWADHEPILFSGERRLIQWCEENNVPAQRFQYAYE